ncbi:hypothetical protein TSTA_070380 [Talaromyces stipitatus ATCC 10500]|uniref:DUF659 domain-containing protein n=1 Tax=Talaromyces stipitatus (strain ATCC 10500 / CBS 375.48 / QM 6759 / NRRL 1006) TaxID=441959 RepID=B8LTN3_TALSN|nr:uncharacterized protein TSTA_070380 [Talaromyces stipitatus ATCC 10500]EED23625.1 hypothetical protein TSTA_070380 [Talaromyces stipitatus ATCC 10500]
MSNTASHDEFDLVSLASNPTEVTEGLETSLRYQRSASSVASTAKPQHKKRRSNNLLWEHTRPPKEGEDVRNKHKQEIYYCKHLTAEGVSRFAFNNIIKDIFGKQLEKQAGHDIDQEKHLRTAIQEAEFKEACVRLITVCNLPHSLLDWAEFWAVILSAIVAHWADTDTRSIECALLLLKEFKGSHSGEEQARVFIEVINEAGLQGKLGCLIMDNATSNDKMLRYITKETENFDPILYRVRCFGYIINPVIQAFLFGAKNHGGEDLMDQEEAISLAIKEIRLLTKETNRDIRDKVALGSLGKLHNINIWVRASTERYQNFIKAIGRAILIGNDTRWNSWSAEINVALTKR